MGDGGMESGGRELRTLWGMLMSGGGKERRDRRQGGWRVSGDSVDCRRLGYGWRAGVWRLWVAVVEACSIVVRGSRAGLCLE